MKTMTEKRFYYNTFYYPRDMDRVMEYEIIDRESYPNYPDHDEKEDLPNWVIYINENDSGWQDMIVDLLNKQDQRIKELEKRNKDYDNAINEISNILMEAYEHGISNPYLKKIGKVKVENR